MTHLTFEEISDAAETGAPPAHVSECAQCRAAMERVQRLLAETRSLPRELVPPDDVWARVRAGVAAERPRARGAAHWWHNGWMASAAALVLMLGTATIV